MKLNVIIRPIEPKDNQSLKELISTILAEFGAEGEGYAGADPELEDMFLAYSKVGFGYWVIERNDKVLGGAGIGYLNDKSGNYCELQKMYFDKEIRGLGLGKTLIKKCLSFAAVSGYKYCYLETLPNMKRAINLYKMNGFFQIENRIGNTGHSKCPFFMLKELALSE